MLAAAVVLAALFAAAVPGYASGGPGAPKATAAMGGPAHCWTGGDDGAPDPCDHATGGRPYDAVNLYSGNLTIWDTPAYYESVGDAIPFTVFYNASVPKGMGVYVRLPFGGGLWNHSYNVYVVAYDGASIHGAYVAEGNGWVHFFTLNVDGTYTAREGIEDTLVKTYSGSTWTGWKLTRLDNHKLNFTTSGELTSIADRNGLTWTLSYTGTGATRRLSSIADPCNRATTLDYTYYSGPNCYVLTGVNMPGGVSAQFGYTTVGYSLTLTSITDAVGDTYYFGYSSLRVISRTDPSGRETDYVMGNDGAGNLRVTSISIAGDTDSAVQYTYDWSGAHPTERWTYVKRTKDGAVVQTRYVHSADINTPSAQGTLLNKIEDYGNSPHLNLTQTWAYDSQMRLCRYRDSYEPETGGKSHRHFFEYNDSYSPWRVTKYIDPENSDAGESGTPSSNCPGFLYQYDREADGDPLADGLHLGRLTKITTPASRVTDLTFESGSSRLSSIVIRDEDAYESPVDRTTSFAYYSGSDPVYRRYKLQSVTDGESNVTSYYYDSNGYLDYMEPPFGNDLDVTANDVGDITAVTDGNGNTTSFAYDGIHRLTSTTYPDVGAGQKTRTFDWTCCGLDLVTDENGVQTKYEYDDYTRRLWKVHEDYTGLNYLTTYGYDEVGNLTTVLNARGKTTTYWYDAANRPYHVDYPDGTHESWTNRDDRRVASHTDARGRVTYYHYDADDRPATVGSTEAVDYPNDTDVDIGRDEDGLVTSLSDASGTSSLVYYPSTWLKSLTDGAGKAVTYDYNGVGNVGTMWTPDGLGFAYGYNAINELASVETPSGVAVSMDYDDAGRLSRITRPGSYIDYQYNARNWVTAVLNRTTGGSTLYDARYYYNDGSLWDHVGNPLLRTEDFGSGLWTTTLGYDNVYRQTQETLVGPNSTTVSDLGYGYDAVGNRTTRTKDGVPVTYTYDNNDKLTSANDGSSFGYDGAGNMTSVSGPLGSWTLSYDDESRLSAVSYPDGADSFTYNALGQRTRASLDGTILRYVYNGDRVLEETSDAGSVLARHTTASGSYYGPWLHMWRSDGSSRFPLFDAVGSARGLVDASAAVTDSYVLDSFGSPTAAATATVNPYRYGGAWGYITDTPGSGLLQLGARYYSPELGRFIQQDPVGDGMNWYAYAGNNPLAYIDPYGLFTINGFGGQPWLIFDRGTGKQLGMSARATASGIIRGVTLGGISPDWRDPCDPWANWSRNWGTVSGVAIAGALAAEASGFNPEFRALPKSGGFEIKWTSNFRTGWHRLPEDVEGWGGRNLPHYHRRGPGGIGAHHPWEKGW
jgi:RHS repeat-associated protein